LKPIKRIAITGPESTGKTWLAKNLAAYFHTVYVPEYAVEYLLEHGPAYTLKDIENIAKGQLELEEQYVQKAGGLLFCDTDLLVCKINTVTISICSVFPIYNGNPDHFVKTRKTGNIFLICMKRN